MDTTIEYLELVREDLLDAGTRPGRRRGRLELRGRFSGRTLVAAAASLALLASGTIGWFVTRSGPGAVRAAFTPMLTRPVAGPSATPAPSERGGADASSVRFDSIFAGQPVDTTRTDAISRVIRTGQLGLVIPRDSFDDRFAKASEIATDNGGYVQTSTTRERSGSLTIRVPAANFDQTLTALRALGDVEVQSIQGKDVTADYVDLHARLRIAKSRREVLLRLMDKATSIEQTIRVQNALDDTQLRIEEIQGQLNLLDDRTSLATVRLDLREQGVKPASEVKTASIPNAFDRAVAGFVGVIAGVVVGLGYVIPVLLLGLAAWFVVARVRRRRLA